MDSVDKMSQKLQGNVERCVDVKTGKETEDECEESLSVVFMLYCLIFSIGLLLVKEIFC